MLLLRLKESVQIVASSDYKESGVTLYSTAFKATNATSSVYNFLWLLVMNKCTIVGFTY